MIQCNEAEDLRTNAVNLKTFKRNVQLGSKGTLDEGEIRSFKLAQIVF